MFVLQTKVSKNRTPFARFRSVTSLRLPAEIKSIRKAKQSSENGRSVRHTTQATFFFSNPRESRTANRFKMSEVDYAENYMEQDDYSDNESSEGNDLKVSSGRLRVGLCDAANALSV